MKMEWVPWYLNIHRKKTQSFCEEKKKRKQQRIEGGTAHRDVIVPVAGCGRTESSNATGRQRWRIGHKLSWLPPLQCCS